MLDLMWPDDTTELKRSQIALARARPSPWEPESYSRIEAGGCFVCFPRGREGEGAAGDLAWAGAASLSGRRRVVTSVTGGAAGAPYQPGLLALREGPVLEAAVRGLARMPDVLLVNATGRDHPRRAGMALHLGSELGVPSVGVTHRPLLASGEWPEDRAGAAAPLLAGGEVVGFWLRTRAGRRPVAVHAGWRVAPEVAVEVVRRRGGRHRTPEPLREARRLARTARADHPAAPSA